MTSAAEAGKCSDSSQECAACMAWGVRLPPCGTLRGAGTRGRALVSRVSEQQSFSWRGNGSSSYSERQAARPRPRGTPRSAGRDWGAEPACSSCPSPSLKAPKQPQETTAASGRSARRHRIPGCYHPSPDLAYSLTHPKGVSPPCIVIRLTDPHQLRSSMSTSHWQREPLAVPPACFS